MSWRLSCHCGALVLAVDLKDGLRSARRCDCSFCRRRGAVMVAAPLEGLRWIRGADHARLYQWGSCTARHYFCPTCGIYTHHRRRRDPTEYGINAGALDGVDVRALEPVAWLDGVNHPSDRKD